MRSSDHREWMRGYMTGREISVPNNSKLLTFDIKIVKGVSNKLRGREDSLASGVVISNLLACVRKGENLVYSRNKANKASGRRNLTTHQVVSSVEKLEKEGLITTHVGKASLNTELRKISYIRPTLKLISMFNSETLARECEEAWLDTSEFVEVRDKDKNKIRLDNEEIDQMRRDMKFINEVNSKAEIRDEGGNRLSNYYCRIFNQDTNHGGRFYKADILTLKNSDDKRRLKITINGDPVVECDYSTLHLRMLAILEGVKLENAYEDLYERVPLAEKSPSNRKLVKIAVNILLNARTVRSALGAIQDELNTIKTSYKTAKEVYDLIVSTYPEFKRFFCHEESYGLKLQCHDSRVANKILLYFANKGIPCLCVHDSFIVQEVYMDMLIQVMADSFREYFGVDVSVPIGVESLSIGKKSCIS